MTNTIYRLDDRVQKQLAHSGVLGPIMDSILRSVNGTSVCHSSSIRCYDEK